MEKKPTGLTFVESLFIFVGIVAGGYFSYQEWPNLWGTLFGAFCGGLIAYFGYRPAQTLRALKGVLWDSFVRNVFGNRKVFGSSVLWSGAFATSLFSFIWVCSTLIRAVGVGQKKPGDNLDILGSAYAAAEGYISNPAWSYALIGISVVAGLFCGFMYVYDNRGYGQPGLRPAIALRWYAIGNPVSAIVIVGLFSTIVFFFLGIIWLLGLLVQFLSHAPHEIWDAMGWIAIAVLGAGVLLGVYRVMVVVHSYKRTICGVYAAAWSLAGGIGAHAYPSLLVRIEGLSQLPPELPMLVGTGLTGTMMAFVMLWVLQVPIAREIEDRAFAKAEALRHDAEAAGT